MGGYRAAVKDSQMQPPPARLTKALSKLPDMGDMHG